YLAHVEADYSDSDRKGKINALKIATAEQALRTVQRLRQLALLQKRQEPLGPPPWGPGREPAAPRDEGGGGGGAGGAAGVRRRGGTRRPPPRRAGPTRSSSATTRAKRPISSRPCAANSPWRACRPGAGWRARPWSAASTITSRK